MQEGSLLECITSGIWTEKHSGEQFNGPVKGGIYTHAGNYNSTHIFLAEFPEIYPGYSAPSAFNKANFREIQPPMSIPESLFNQSPKKVTV
jgi:hypothetical protein